MRTPAVVTALIALAAAGALAGCGTPRSAGADPTPAGSTAGAAVITTQATGRTKAKPDELNVTLSVQTQNQSAQAALEDNNGKTAALIAKLKSGGVAANDLQTSGLSISPTYDNDTSRVSGYQVTNSVTATFRDLGKAGAVIDTAAGAVGDAIRIDNMGFAVGNDAAARAQARADAVKQAQEQARQIADAAGTKLTRVRAIVEEPAQVVQPSFAYDAAVPAAKSVPIEAGQVELTVEIQVTYEIG